MQSPTRFSRLLLASLCFSLALFPNEKARSQPAAAGSAVEAIHLLGQFPKDVLHDLKPGTKKWDSALDKFRLNLKDKFDKKTASVSFKVKSVDKVGDHFVIAADPVEERVSGTLIMLRYVVILTPSQNALATKFPPGSKLKAVGELFGLAGRHSTGTEILPGLTIQVSNPVF